MAPAASKAGTRGGQWMPIVTESRSSHGWIIHAMCVVGALVQCCRRRVCAADDGLRWASKEPRGQQKVLVACLLRCLMERPHGLRVAWAEMRVSARLRRLPASI